MLGSPVHSSPPQAAGFPGFFPWNGIYIYGDYCTRIIWGLLQSEGGFREETQLFNSGFNIASFGEDAAGEVYLIDYNGGVYHLTPSSWPEN